jgi:uncharacterized iron-regulated membrane protein
MPGANPSNLTLYPNPAKAASVATGPNEMPFLNPYTGQVPGAGSTRMRKFFRVMTDWHRWLALSGEKRSIGKAVTGVPDLSFVQNAGNQTQDWQSINFRLPKANDKTVAFTIDTGSGVKPQHRSTVVLDRSSGNIVRSERFEDMDKGIQARLWMRFVHSGEYYGFAGQTIAGIASAAAITLVYTGLALTFRRCAARTRHRSEGTQ